MLDKIRSKRYESMVDGIVYMMCVLGLFMCVLKVEV